MYIYMHMFGWRSSGWAFAGLYLEEVQFAILTLVEKTLCFPIAGRHMAPKKEALEFHLL